MFGTFILQYNGLRKYDKQNYINFNFFCFMLGLIIIGIIFYFYMSKIDSNSDSNIEQKTLIMILNLNQQNSVI